MTIPDEIRADAEYIRGAAQGNEYLNDTEGAPVWVDPEYHQELLNKADSLARFILDLERKP